MIDLLTTPASELKGKLSLFRKYFFEIVLIGLCFIVYHLNRDHKEIEEKMKQFLISDRTELLKVLQENTRVMRYYQPGEHTDHKTP